TGSKGIGRLAAHKLARLLQIHSVRGTPGKTAKGGISATIDWDAIERCETLDQLTTEAIVEALVLERPASTGTRIQLDGLRRRWTAEERTRFVTECRSLQPPSLLAASLVPTLLDFPLLFEQPL